MKKFILTIGIVLSQVLLFAQCPPGSLHLFSSQSQINEFIIVYPNCTDISGDVVISGGNIQNLYGLGNLTSIGGDLQFLYNQALVNLVGMEDLTSVGGNLIFIENYILSSMVGLNNLSFVAGDIAITQNHQMNSLMGLNSVETVGNNLLIVTNGNLKVFSGLGNLTTIGNSLYIEENPELVTFDGLENLTTIGGDLAIRFNDTLTSVEDLQGLTTIGGELAIRSNYDLTSLTGLDNIEPTSINSLVILSNFSLSSCEVLSICEYLANPTGSILISNNETGCKTQQEVEDACEAVSIEEDDMSQNISIFPNPASSRLSIDISKEPAQNTKLIISNINGQAIHTQQITEPKTEIDISSLSAGIYIVKLQSAKEAVTQKLVVN